MQCFWQRQYNKYKLVMDCNKIYAARSLDPDKPHIIPAVSPSHYYVTLQHMRPKLVCQSSSLIGQRSVDSATLACDWFSSFPAFPSRGSVSQVPGSQGSLGQDLESGDTSFRLRVGNNLPSTQHSVVRQPGEIQRNLHSFYYIPLFPHLFHLLDPRIVASILFTNMITLQSL